ncbi:MAG: glucokinase [Candidatus Zixiibacteriota bacterium]|nr:MAG: glucokinase [candidate division Zixibacteria bacterium]
MIAGYLTATTTDLARVTVHAGKPRLVHHRSFINQEFSGFDSVLELYFRKTKGEKKNACFGVAGPVINDRVVATNIPWKISAGEIKKRHGLPKVTLVNDLVATAYGLFQLGDDDFVTLNKGKKAKNGNIGLVAAGDGLGEALIFYDGAKYCPYASEGGHVSFSPGSQIETELWEYLYSNQGYVEAEDVISLPGLQHIYEFTLAVNRATKADWYKKAKDKPGRIIEYALSGKDEIAVKTLDMFIDCYASEAANLALKGITLGGIYLGGLIAPRIMTALEQGRFMERFVKKGKLASLLSDIPVSLIIEEKTALIGAAAVAAEITAV